VGRRRTKLGRRGGQHASALCHTGSARHSAGSAKWTACVGALLATVGAALSWVGAVGSLRRRSANRGRHSGQHASALY